MQTHQYQQLLIRLDYVNTVCDELLMRKYILAFAENDNNDDNYQSNNHLKDKPHLQINKSSMITPTTINQQQRYFYQSQPQVCRNKLLVLQGQLQLYKDYYKRLKQQVYVISKSLQQKKNMYQSSKNNLLTSSTQQHYKQSTTTKNNNFIINNNNIPHKQIQQQLSSLQVQLQNQKKLLNTQLKGYNAIQQSKIQIKQTLAKLQNRQNQLIKKLSSLNKQQKSYLHCVKLQAQYQSLLKNKRTLIDKLQHLGMENNQLIESKSTAIAQSKQNLKQMQRYFQQLQFLIIQQRFIIDEIQSRQGSMIGKYRNTKHKHKNKHNSSDQQITNDGIQQNTIQNDNKIFQQEIAQLRKTIANRKFLSRKQQKAIRKLDQFVNITNRQMQVQYKGKDKNQKLINNNKSNYESIFKIQIQPISHSSPVNVKRDKLISNGNYNKKINQQQQIKRKLLSVHRNSMPSKLSKIQHNKITNCQDHNVNHQQQHNCFNNKIQYINNNNNNIVSSSLKSKSDNKINNLSSNEIDVLEKILKDKQKYIQQLLSRDQKNNMKNSLFTNDKMVGQSIQYNPGPKQMVKTQPIQQYKIVVGSNSRLIQKLIYQKTKGNSNNNKVDHFKSGVKQLDNNSNIIHTPNSNNVRIRTKRSQSQRINQFNKFKQKIDKSKGINKKRVGFSYMQQSQQSQANNISIPNIQNSQNIRNGNSATNNKIRNIDNNQIQQQNIHQQQQNHSKSPYLRKQLPSIIRQQHDNQQQQNNKKYHKYNHRISQFLQDQKRSIDNVFKKIQQIKHWQSQKQTINSDDNNNDDDDKNNNLNQIEKDRNKTPKQKHQSKIKIFKLSTSNRKYSNSLSFYRKGIAQGVEVGSSDDDDQDDNTKKRGGKSYKLEQSQLFIQRQLDEATYNNQNQHQQQHHDQNKQQLQRILQQQQQSIRNTLKSIAKMESGRVVVDNRR